MMCYKHFVLPILVVLLMTGCASSKQTDWLQGVWTAETPFGRFEIKIDGNSIIDYSDRMNVQIGSFTLEDEKLKVHFEGDPKGLCTVYNLDLKLHRIGIGYGFYLEKE